MDLFSTSFHKTKKTMKSCKMQLKRLTLLSIGKLSFGVEKMLRTVFVFAVFFVFFEIVLRRFH